MNRTTPPDRADTVDPFGDTVADEPMSGDGLSNADLPPSALATGRLRTPTSPSSADWHASLDGLPGMSQPAARGFDDSWRDLPLARRLPSDTSDQADPFLNEVSSDVEPVPEDVVGWAGDEAATTGGHRDPEDLEEIAEEVTPPSAHEEYLRMAEREAARLIAQRVDDQALTACGGAETVIEEELGVFQTEEDLRHGSPLVGQGNETLPRRTIDRVMAGEGVGDKVGVIAPVVEELDAPAVEESEVGSEPHVREEPATDEGEAGKPPLGVPQCADPVIPEPRGSSTADVTPGPADSTPQDAAVQETGPAETSGEVTDPANNAGEDSTAVDEPQRREATDHEVEAGSPDASTETFQPTAQAQEATEPAQDEAEGSGAELGEPRMPKEEEEQEEQEQPEEEEGRSEASPPAVGVSPVGQPVQSNDPAVAPSSPQCAAGTEAGDTGPKTEPKASPVAAAGLENEAGEISDVNAGPLSADRSAVIAPGKVTQANASAAISQGLDDGAGRCSPVPIEQPTESDGAPAAVPEAHVNEPKAAADPAAEPTPAAAAAAATPPSVAGEVTGETAPKAPAVSAAPPGKGKAIAAKSYQWHPQTPPEAAKVVPVKKKKKLTPAQETRRRLKAMASKKNEVATRRDRIVQKTRQSVLQHEQRRSRLRGAGDRDPQGASAPATPPVVVALPVGRAVPQHLELAPPQEEQRVSSTTQRREIADRVRSIHAMKQQHGSRVNKLRQAQRAAVLIQRWFRTRKWQKSVFGPRVEERRQLVTQHRERVRREEERKKALAEQEERAVIARAKIAEAARQKRLSTLREPNIRAQQTWLAKAKRRKAQLEQLKQQGRAAQRHNRAVPASVTVMHEPSRHEQEAAPADEVPDSPPPLVARTSRVKDLAVSAQGGAEAVGSARVVVVGGGDGVRDATTSARRPSSGDGESPVPEEFQDWVREETPPPSSSGEDTEGSVPEEWEGRLTPSEADGREVVTDPRQQPPRMGPSGLQVGLPPIHPPTLGSQRRFKHFEQDPRHMHLGLNANQLARSIGSDGPAPRLQTF